jgi:hypothetical protein
MECLNLHVLQRVAAVGRQVTTPYKGEDGIRQEYALYNEHYNLSLSHTSLPQALAWPEPTMAYAWHLHEVVMFRVPP